MLARCTRVRGLVMRPPPDSATGRPARSHRTPTRTQGCYPVGYPLRRGDSERGPRRGPVSRPASCGITPPTSGSRLQSEALEVRLAEVLGALCPFGRRQGAFGIHLSFEALKERSSAGCGSCCTVGGAGPRFVGTDTANDLSRGRQARPPWEVPCLPGGQCSTPKPRRWPALRFARSRTALCGVCG